MMNQGHSLPPGVAGSPLGNLKICLVECTVPHFKSLCLEFWGSASTNEIALCKVLDIPLVGTISSLDKYLQDASPLPIRVLGSTRRIGSSSIPDISFSALRQTKRKPLTLTRRFRFNCASETENKCIGIIVLDVSFSMDRVEAITDDYFQRRTINDVALGRGRCINDSSIGNTEGHQSLLEELLDLCADDMTIPTLPSIDDTSSSCAASNLVDPFDAWISRVEMKAALPPHHGISLKIEVSKVLISSEILERLDNKIRMYLNYEIKREQSESDCAEEVLLCEHVSIGELINQRSAKKMIGDRYVSLMDKPHFKEIEITVDDDESISSRLDGDIHFCLSYVHLQKRKQQNSKQKIIGCSKRPYNTQRFQSNRQCLGTAVVHLRQVLSHEACVTVEIKSSNARSNTNLQDIKVGSLVLNICSVPCSIALKSYDERQRDETSTSKSYTPTSSDEDPRHKSALHPVSVFLANFTSSAKSSRHQELDVTNKHSFGECIVQRNECEQPKKHSLEKQNEKDPKSNVFKSRILHPVHPLPLWISIVVSKIELGSRVVIRSKMMLKVSCSDAMSLVNDIREQSYDAQCSWQLKLKEGCNPANVGIVINLTSEDSLNAIAYVKLYLDEKVTRRPHTNGLPNIITSGWFDVLDARCGSQIGKIRVELFVGTLKHSRGFPLLCKNSMLVQRWWRRTLASREGAVATRTISEWVGKGKEAACETSSPRDQAVCHQLMGDYSICSSPTKVACSNSHSLQHITSSSDPEVIESCNAHTKEQTTQKIISSDASSHSRSNISTCCQQPTTSGGRSRGIESCYDDTEKLPASEQMKTDMPSSFIHGVDELLGSSISMKRKNEATSSPDSLFEEWSRTVVSEQDEVARKLIVAKAQSTAEQSGIGICRSHKGDQEVARSSFDPGTTDTASATSVSCRIESLVNPPTQNRDIDSHISALEEKTAKSSDSTDRFELEVRVLSAGGLLEIVNEWCKLEQLTAIPVSGLFISVGGTYNHEDDEFHRIFHCGEICHSRLISLQECSREQNFDEFKATVHVANYESNLATIQTQVLIFKLWFVPVITKAVVRAFNRDGAGEIKSHSLNGSSLVATASVPLYHLYTPEDYYEGRVPWTICGSDISLGHISSIVHRSGDPYSGMECSLDETHYERDPRQLHMSAILPLNLQNTYSPEVTKRRSIDPPSRSFSAGKRKVDPNPAKEHSSLVLRDYKRSRVLQENSGHSEAPATSAGQAYSQLRESRGTKSSHSVLDEETSMQLEVIKDSKLKVISKEKGDSSHRIPGFEAAEGNKNTSKDSTFSFDHAYACEIRRSIFEQDQDLPCNASTPYTSTLSPESNQGALETIDTSLQAIQKATCEQGSSPILVTLRYADASTSPCNQVPVATTRKSFDGPIAKDETKNQSSEKKNPSLPNEENMEPMAHQHRNQDISSAFETKSRSEQISINKRLEQAVIQIGKDENNSKTHQLRTRLMENYFEGAHAIYGTGAEGYNSTKSPVYSRSSGIFSLAQRVSSDYQGNILRSSLRSSSDPLSCSSNRSMPQFQSTATSPTTHNILSNRERIERIFSGRK